MSTISWSPTPEKIQSSNLNAFMAYVQERTGKKFNDYNGLWQWSVDEKDIFWDCIWDFCDVKGDKGDVLFDDNGGQMFGAQFYPQGRINYAENVTEKLKSFPEDQPAMIFRDEQGQETIASAEDVYARISKWQQALKDAGIVKGDRVAAYMPNMMETIIACMATASIGAIWSSASPDFGVQGVLDRFGQIEPKILIAVDGYYYNGKVIDVLEKVSQIVPQIKSLEKTIIVPFAGSSVDAAQIKNAVGKDAFLDGYDAQDQISYERVEFNHPLFIMFSSGTTGVPKCIVHGHGGTLLQHLKEHQLQCDIKAGDQVFYFTTCGWMMWNWLITATASGATLLLYDGSPFYPNGNVLWDYTTKHGCTLFGTSAKYIEAMNAHDIIPAKTHDLSALRTLTSTGSPLVHASFDFIYDAIKSDLHVASISGGTDVISCFILGNPISPVYRGEIQGAGLGMAVDVFDENDQPIKEGAGELVCTQAFPSMPVCFWNDQGGEKYKSAYFDKIDNIWVHGDWVEKTASGGLIILGRSDATLNPGGVRIGTAEIYRQIEKIDAIEDSVVIGQDWEGDVRVVLFVVMKKGWNLDSNLIKEIKTAIRKGASPRHVPAKIIEVTDIPRTKSGKITEIAVRDVVMGRPIKNVEALANPESLELYKDIEELQS